MSKVKELEGALNQESELKEEFQNKLKYVSISHAGTVLHVRHAVVVVSL